MNADTLGAIASAYVAAMTSIRGRRVHRLVMRQLGRFDHVLPARTRDGGQALLAVGDDGCVALCQTDGRGPTVCLDAWAGPEARRGTTCFDLKRDSLPVVTRTVGDADFPAIARSLAIAEDDLRRVSASPVHRFFAVGANGGPAD
jgi:hypothetical protein